MPCLIWRLSSEVPLRNLASVTPKRIIVALLVLNVSLHTFRQLVNLWYSAFKTVIFSRLKLFQSLVVSSKKSMRKSYMMM